MNRIPTNSVSHRARQATYRDRRKAGLVPVVLPWHWLTLADVQRLAVEAYRIASHDMLEGLKDVSYPTTHDAEDFGRGLQEVFETLVADAANAAGIGASPSNSPFSAKCMREDLPADWKPQYPIFVPAQP